MSGGERVKVAKIAEYAIRTLGYRTAAFANAFAPNRTHSEQIEFLQRHPRLLQCVKWIYEAESERSVSNVIPLGTAAGLMFLMGSAGDTGEKYTKALKETSRPHENMLKWGHWDLAEKFWEAIGNSDKKMFPIKEALAQVSQDGDSISKDVQMGIIVKAWNLFSNGKPLTAESLALQFQEDGEGRKHLTEKPLISPIDLGSPKAVDDEEKEDPVDEEPEVLSEDDKLARKAARNKLHKPIKEGDMVWVKCDPVESRWRGELTELAGKNARVQVPKGLAGAGKQQAVLVTQLSLIAPDGVV